jgi:hypothetical protein
VADSQASLIQQVLSGRNRQLKRLAAEGMLPLSPEQLIPLQVMLAGSAESELAACAEETLRQADPRRIAPYLARQAPAEVLTYFATRPVSSLLQETLLRRRDLPHSLLEVLARRLSADLQEILLLRQDAIIESPEILEALEENPQISIYSQRRILEYREHLLRRRPVPAAEDEEMPESEFLEAIAQVRRLPAEGEVEEHVGLTEGQVRMLPVPARIRLTRGASRLMRSILVRDSNARVAVSVLVNNALSEQELEQVCRSRNVVEEVLVEIARRRDWIGKLAIQRAMVQNPKTPVAIALRLINKLGVRDLRELSRDRNIAEGVRSTALRLYRIKRQ